MLPYILVCCNMFPYASICSPRWGRATAAAAAAAATAAAAAAAAAPATAAAAATVAAATTAAAAGQRITGSSGKLYFLPGPRGY